MATTKPTPVPTYGYPDATSDPNRGPSVKFWFDDCNSVLCPTGPANLPSYGFYNLCSPTYTFLNGTPDSGVVYNFYPSPATSVRSPSTSEVAVYPNPFRDRLTVSFAEVQTDARLTLLDLLGRTVHTQTFSGRAAFLERGDWSDGVYWLRIEDRAHGVRTKRVVVHGRGK